MTSSLISHPPPTVTLAVCLLLLGLAGAAAARRWPRFTPACAVLSALVTGNVVWSWLGEWLAASPDGGYRQLVARHLLVAVTTGSVAVLLPLVARRQGGARPPAG